MLCATITALTLTINSGNTHRDGKKTQYTGAIAATYKRGYARQECFHEIAQKNRAQHKEPRIAGRHVCSSSLLQLWSRWSTEQRTYTTNRPVMFVLVMATSEQKLLILFIYFFKTAKPVHKLSPMCHKIECSNLRFVACVVYQ